MKSEQLLGSQVQYVGFTTHNAEPKLQPKPISNSQSQPKPQNLTQPKLGTPKTLHPLPTPQTHPLPLT